MSRPVHTSQRLRSGLMALALSLGAAAGAAPADSDARLDEVRRLIDLGEGASARAIAADTLARSPEVAAEVRYLTGVAWQVDEEHEAAIDQFRAVLRLHRRHPRTRDARFRMALSFGATDRPRRALTASAPLRRHAETPADRARLALSRGVWRFEAGQRRGGITTLSRWFAALDADDEAWYQSRARISLIRHHAAAAQRPSLGEVPERRWKRVLGVRLDHLREVAFHLNALPDHGPSAYIPEAIRLTAEAYEALADDILRAPAPRRLTGDQLRIYHEGVRHRAEGQYVVALRYADLGAQYARRNAVAPEAAASLDAVHARVAAKVDALTP